MLLFFKEKGHNEKNTSEYAKKGKSQKGLPLQSVLIPLFSRMNMEGQYQHCRISGTISVLIPGFQLNCYHSNGKLLKSGVDTLLIVSH